MSATSFPVDGYSATHDEWLETRHIVMPTLRAVVSPHLHNACVLDVGCGTGFLSNVMLVWGAKSVQGIDIAHRMIEICRERYGGDPALHFIQSSIMDMNYYKEFDVALAIFVLHFSKTITELEEALCAIYKSLKKGGRLFAFVPNGTENLSSMSEDEGRKLGARLMVNGDRRFDGERMTVRFYSLNGEIAGETEVTFFFRRTYEKALHNAGFSSIQWFTPLVSEEAMNEYGEKLFAKISEQPCDIVFSALKET